MSGRPCHNCGAFLEPVRIPNHGGQSLTRASEMTSRTAHCLIEHRSRIVVYLMSLEASILAEILVFVLALLIIRVRSNAVKALRYTAEPANSVSYANIVSKRSDVSDTQVKLGGD
jgi:hypothetical protein